MQEIKVDAILSNLGVVNDFINKTLMNLNCDKKTQMHLALVTEEIFVNISSYAYTESIGQVTIQTEIENNPRSVKIIFIDNGIEYNPLENEMPDINLSVEEREIGGLGIFLVRKIVDEIEYRYEDTKNILTVKKFL